MNIAIRSPRLPLSQGKYALVDPDDYEYLSQFKWFAFTTTQGRTFYAARTIYPSDGHYFNLRMHQAILGQPINGYVIDHINHDGLDNRRKNLRICSIGENCTHSRNYRLTTVKESNYRGVYRVGKVTKKWASAVRHNGVLINLGRHDSEREAAMEYDKAVLKLKGKFAMTNFNWAEGDQR